MAVRLIRSGLAVLVVVLAVALDPQAAGALTQTVSGTAVGGSDFGGTLGFVTDLTYTSTGPLGSGTMHLDYSLTFVTGGITTEGTVVLTRADGATLTGTESGTADLTTVPIAVEIDLAFTAGTGALAGATAELHFTGTSTGPGGVDNFTFTGTLTTAATPTTKADCKNGGWRDLANAQGQPFRNQGQCVSYVVAHRR